MSIADGLIDPKQCRRSTVNVKHFLRFRKSCLTKLFQQLKRNRSCKPSLARYINEKKQPRDKASLHQSEFGKLRPLILARDGYQCRKCARPQTLNLKHLHPDSFQVHHVNSWRDNRPGCLRTLCLACHIFAPNGRAYWAWERSDQDRLRIESLRSRMIEESRSVKLREQVQAELELFSSPDLYNTLLDLIEAFEKTLDRIRAKTRAA